MDYFKKIAKYSFISSNIASSLAMQDKKINQINKSKEVQFNSIKSLGTYMNEEGTYEKKILHNCYLVYEIKKNECTLINENYLEDVEIEMFYNKSNNNINIKNERLNNVPFFILNIKIANKEKNIIFNCNSLNYTIPHYLTNILKENEKNYDIFCLGSNNKDKNIIIRKDFFRGLDEAKGIINIKNLNSFKYENIMSSFNMTKFKNIILPNNLKTNDFTNIDSMNNNEFSNKFYYIARTYNFDINEVCEKYYIFSKGVINEDNIKNFEEHLKTKKLEKSEI